MVARGTPIDSGAGNVFANAKAAGGSLATVTETRAGTVTDKAVTPAGTAILKQANLHDTYTGKGTVALVAADSGQTWNTSGTPADPSIISGKAGFAQGTACAAYWDVGLSAQVSRIGARWTFTTAGSTNDGYAVIVAWATSFTSPVPDSPLHLVISPVLAQLTFWEAGVSSSAVLTYNFPTALAADDTTVHECDVVFEGDTATIRLPDGSTHVVTDSRIASINGDFAGWEVFQAATSHSPRFIDVWADARPQGALAATPLATIYKAIGEASIGATWSLFGEYTTAGTTGSIVLPFDTIEADVVVVAAGSGGGSGRRGAAASARGGGGGGGGGQILRGNIKGSLLTETFTVVVGASGAGGAAVTANDTNGNAGAAGGLSSLSGSVSGTVVLALGSFQAAGGTTAGGTAGFSYPGEDVASASGGTGGAAGAAGFAASVGRGASGGGGGGGITAADVAGNGGNSGIVTIANSFATGGAGAGAAGTAVPTEVRRSGIRAGAGGAGGAGSTTVAAFVGGAGANPGGGGGGGGASLNGNNSGAGGAGAVGYVAIWVLRP